MGGYSTTEALAQKESSQVSQTEKPPVRIVNAALSERKGRITLRGEIDPMSLMLVGVDEYQREVLLGIKAEQLDEELTGEGVPDVELGMRGESFEEIGDGVFLLHDPTYVIDGLQRISSGIRVLPTQPEDELPFIGAAVLFNTTYEFEKDRFLKTNYYATRVNGTVILHPIPNDDSHKAIGLLYKLAYKADPKKAPKEGEFVLAGRVSWKQRLNKRDLLTALVMVKVAAVLHNHAGPGKSNQVLPLADNLERTVTEVIGQRNYTANVKHFFEVVDRAWGLQNLDSREGAEWLNGKFLAQLAEVFSDHPTFWREDNRKLQVDSSTVKKLGGFRFDQVVINLVRGGGVNDGNALYNLIVRHLNSGRRTNRLVPRDTLAPLPEDPEAGGEGTE